MKWKVTDIATIEVYGKDRRRDKIILRNMREEFQELGDAYMFKEKRLCGHLSGGHSWFPVLSVIRENLIILKLSAGMKNRRTVCVDRSVILKYLPRSYNEKHAISCM